jgi:Cof subfamily protein (haloacid dehalogenase superfamily)
MIVTDLDKTLLDNNCNISEYSRSILTKCMDKNIIVVFATARPIRATVIYYPVLKPHAIICHNGAKILADDNTIYQCGIRKEVYNNIIDKLTRHFPGFNIAIEINDKIYANYDPSVYWGKIDYENLNSRPDENADKIIVGLGDKTNIDEIEKYLPEYLYLERSRGSVEGNLALIMNKAATKWNAVRELSKYHNIDTENIAAFGDNENDLDMVRNCGMGVAVENAIDEVKNAAKGICDSNDKDGVANWIEKNILLCQ